MNGLQSQGSSTTSQQGVRFTDADAKAYYEEHPDEFKVAAGRVRATSWSRPKAEGEQHPRRG